MAGPSWRLGLYSLGYIPQHCVLKARYLHRAYYTYLIHEITLECVQLYGHNSILSGVVGARWLPPRRAQLVGVAVDIAVSGITCQYKNYN